jgi:hypothetical protein
MTTTAYLTKDYSVACPNDNVIHTFLTPDSTITAYLLNGLLHNVNDPALITPLSKSWYTQGVITKKIDNQATYLYANGKLHMNTDPAIVWVNGAKDWYQNGINYNPNGPSSIYADGTQIWNDSTGKFVKKV